MPTGNRLPYGVMNGAYLELAVAAVREAAKLVRRAQANRRTIQPTKKKGSWVTNVDKASEELIRDMIMDRHPEHSFLGEESGLTGESDHCWVADPLDGTTNFVHGFPGYCISLAYVVQGKGRVGVVYDVGRDDLYVAERGKGMFLNDRRCRPYRTRLLSEALVVSLGGIGSEGWMRRMISEISRKSEGVRRTGSTALDLAMLAAGHFDGAFGNGMRYWDYAAAAIMVQENGGMFIPVHLDGYEYGKTTGYMVGGSPEVAAELRKQILSLRAEQTA